MYNNISYNKDYYTIEKLMNSRKQNSVVYENDNYMWLVIKNNLPLLLFQISILIFFDYDMPFRTRTQMENNMRY
jgi:hypothetical protein